MASTFLGRAEISKHIKVIRGGNSTVFENRFLFGSREADIKKLYSVLRNNQVMQVFENEANGRIFSFVSFYFSLRV